MIVKDYKEINLPLLGYGCMRLPTLPDGEIDREEVFRLVDYAMAHGVNYFDTAYPYHGGKSEIVIGEALRRYPRESYYLADKYPGHQIMSEYKPAEVFSDQLEKCGVDYFDFYLLHNVNERSIDTYRDARWGIIDYFVEMKRQGKIRFLGFSTHARLECLGEFLDEYGEYMDFCQIQMNYLDYTLQLAGEKYKMLTERGIAVWVMEPVRGGKLAALSPEIEKRLGEHRPGASCASFAFRWLQGFENVKMILSGMSNMEQLADNISTFREYIPLTNDERELLTKIADGMMKSVPCTACRYCVDGCPMGLDIPLFMATYNELATEISVNSAIHIQSLPAEKQPNACVTCSRCTRSCPQNIDIPLVIRNLCRLLEKTPNWEKICREREAAQAKLAESKKKEV